MFDSGTLVHSVAKHDSSVAAAVQAHMSSGSYTGNDTVNRAIAHGMSGKPKMVLCDNESHAAFQRIIEDDTVNYVSDAAKGAQGVTVMDTTNFYVGNAAAYDRSMNATGVIYHWVAIS